jgi:peptide subunit release factor 1 (eRF1)
VIDKIPVDVKHESPEDILEKARASNENAERREEKSLVETIVEEAGAGGRGALGLEATLGALLEGRIQKMVLLEGFEHAGWECGRCAYLSVRELDRCLLCGGDGHPLANVADVAVERVILGSGGVDFIFEGPAHEILSAKGGVGALLRF